MKKVEGTRHEGCSRGFIWTGKAWYAEVALTVRDLQDEISIGMYDDDGKTMGGEFFIEFTTLSGESVPRLRAYDDSWEVLVKHYSDLLHWMAEHDDKNASPEEIVDALKALGVKDKTPYEKYL